MDASIKLKVLSMIEWPSYERVFRKFVTISNNVEAVVKESFIPATIYAIEQQTDSLLQEINYEIRYVRKTLSKKNDK